MPCSVVARAMRALLVGVLLAGCVGVPADADGRAAVHVVATGAPAFVELRAEDAVLWSARLAAGEGRLAPLAVPTRGCLDVEVVAGFEGREPDEVVRLLRVCDADASAVRAEFSPPP